MKKRTILGFVFLFILMFSQAYAADKTATPSILEFSSEDGKSQGYIEQTTFSLAENETILINMDDVFAMYPEHTGIYGYLYAPSEVTVTAGESSATGQGVLEFSFPGAQSCTVTGSGDVYAYFLPVPYMKLSTSGSLIDQSFNTSYLTETSVEHYNMFMLADPRVYVFQESVPYANTVYKYHSILGPLPQQYQYMDHGWDGTIFYSYVSEHPVLIQCCAIDRDSYDTDTYIARKMFKASSGDGYEIWTYQDYTASSSDIYERINKVFNASMALAREEILTSTVDFDPIVMVMLGEELRNFGMAGLAINDEKSSKIGFRSFVFVDASSWEQNTAYISYLFAHELGHIIQSRTLSHNFVSYAQWFQEGFATYFGEKVSALLGDHYKERKLISQDDALALEKFKADMVFGISSFEQYNAVGFENADVLMLPHDAYGFGCCFMYYLEEKYGEGFYKGIADSFYEGWYKGHEDAFFLWRNILDYNMDKYYELIKEGLSPSVYIDFPAYMAEHYGVYLDTESDTVLP